MSAEKAKEILRKAGALLENEHIVLRSGLHTPTYVNHDPVFERPNFLRELATLLAGLCSDIEVDFVAGPKTGGAILAEWVGRTLGVPDIAILKRGRGVFGLSEANAEKVRRKRVLVLDDVGTTVQGTLASSIRAIRHEGGDVRFATLVWNRGGITKTDLTVEELRCLVVEDIPAYDAGPKHCPMCASGQTVNEDVGHPELWLNKVISGEATGLSQDAPEPPSRTEAFDIGASPFVLDVARAGNRHE